MHCLTAWGQWAVELVQCTAPLPGGSGQCNSCNGWSECSAGPVGMYYWAHRPGGMGSPTQGVVGASFRAYGGPSSSENRAHRPGGDGESRPGGGRSLLLGPMGGHLLQRTGRTGPGGTGSPAQGVFGVSCQANGGPSSSENRAHRPGGDGESCPGGVRSLLPGQRGAIFFREPGAPARGGRGVLPRGCSDPPAMAMGGHLLQRTGRTGLGGTGSPAQGVFGVSCQGQWGAIFFREPGAPARGGRGVLPRGCSESPARPMGGHLHQRTGRTGPGGTGSPAQGVFGVSCKASGGPSSSVGSGTPAMHCPTAWGQWTVQLLQCTASLSQSSGQWNSCNALPHRPGAVGSGTLEMHCLTAWGQRTVQPLQCTASLPWVSGQCNSCNTLPHCLGAVGSATPAMQCLTAWGQWAVQLQLLPRIASLPGGSGRCNFYNARPHCLGAVGSATPAMHCLSALGAVGSGSPAMHCPTAWGYWAVQLLQFTAALPGGSGQRNSCNALPHCPGAVGSGTPATHCLTA